MCQGRGLYFGETLDRECGDLERLERAIGLAGVGRSAVIDHLAARKTRLRVHLLRRAEICLVVRDTQRAQDDLCSQGLAEFRGLSRRQKTFSSRDS